MLKRGLRLRSVLRSLEKLNSLSASSDLVTTHYYHFAYPGMLHAMGLEAHQHLEGLNLERLIVINDQSNSKAILEKLLINRLWVRVP